MKVVQMLEPGGPEVLELAERPLPEPAAGEVRVKAQAIGVSAADILVRKGIYNWMPPLPAIPGNEMAGIVDVIGGGVSGVRVGQKVFVSSRELVFRGGCYAQAICVPAEALFSLPPTIAPQDAVSLGNFQLAGALLYESGVRKPRSILAYGAAGGVGLALVQLAVADGLHAIGVVSTKEKQAYVRAAGVANVLVRKRGATHEAAREMLREQVMALTAGRGVDVVYAMAGPTFVGNLDLLAPLGTLVSFSILGGPIPDADVFGELRKRLGKSLGVRCYSVHALDHDHETRRALMKRAIELMAAGRLRPPPPTVMPLSDAGRAHALMEAGESIGKIVLDPG